MFHQFGDIFIPTRGPALQLTRTYNAQSSANGPFGYGSGSLTRHACGRGRRDRQCDVSNDSGGEYVFVKNGAAYTPPARIFLTLEVSGGFNLRSLDGTTWEFNSTGQLAKITDRNGNAQTLAYTANQLSSVADALGRSLTFSLRCAGARSASMRSSAASMVVYLYRLRRSASSTTPSDGQHAGLHDQLRILHAGCRSSTT